MLVRGGRVVDPAQALDRIMDVRVRDGAVVEIGENLAAEPHEEILDASHAVVAPGFIDMHAHLREPGQTEKETIKTGTAAAAAGGFCAVAAMPNTEPALDSPEALESVLHLARNATVRVYPIAAVTKGRLGRELLDYAALARAGAVAFSDDGSTISNAKIARDAAWAAAGVGRCFISHCEDATLKSSAVMHDGQIARKLGVLGSPSLAEDVMVARDLLIARETGKAWHIAHVSTAGAVELIAWMRSAGGRTTCEVTPHHLFFHDDQVRALGSHAKVNPPLRTPADSRSLRDAVRSGIVDAFATDHAPHTALEKHADLSSGAVGFSGLEIAVGAYALAIPDLPLERFVSLLSTNPARILGIPGGTLRVGSPADITIFADRAWRVEAANFYSKGKSTPFDGVTLPRRAVATIVGGRVVMRDGVVS